MFYLDVAKVDLDVAYTWMLQSYVSGVSYVCCSCFIWMLHMFALVFKYFSGVLASVLGACFKCFIYLFFVAFVCFKSRSGVAYRMRMGSG